MLPAAWISADCLLLLWNTFFIFKPWEKFYISVTYRNKVGDRVIGEHRDEQSARAVAGRVLCIACLPWRFSWQLRLST